MSRFETAAEALAAWDAGESIWSVEMGGLGPGYEQAIQIIAFEAIRYMVNNPPDWDALVADEKARREFWGKLDTAIFAEGQPADVVKPSGAQVGAAKNIAAVFVRQGHKAGLENASKDRLIQVSKNFPTLAESQS